MSDLLHDMGVAARSLLKTPAYAVTIAVVLTLGIGANAAIFTVLDEAVIRPLRYVDPDRLAAVWEDFTAFGVPKQRVSPATFLDWQSRNRSFVQLAAYSMSGRTVTGDGAPEELHGVAATANLLPMLGVEPLLGHTFSSAEEQNRVIVVSSRLWRERLGRRSLDEATLVMNGERYTVIGVMPPGFRFPDGETDYWIPLTFTPAQAVRRNSHYLHVVGRLRSERRWADAKADMDGLARQLAAEHPATNSRVGINVTPLKDELLAGADLSLAILLAAAGCVLLIACANVANLVLVRSSERRHELAIRVALGASRVRVVQSLLLETALLTVVGLAGAVVVARWSVAVIAWLVPAGAGQISGMDTRALLGTVAIAAVAGLVAAGIPAVLISWSPSVLPTGAGDRVVGSGRRARQLLVVTEVALALVLLVAAGLLAETLAKLHAVDGGFRSGSMLTATIAVPYPKYTDARTRQRFFEDVLADVGRIAGVQSAGLASDLPYTSRGNTMAFEIDRRPHGAGVVQDALFRLVSTHYLQTIGARLIAGRLLDDRDRQEAPPVVVINEALARQYWPAGGALGHRIDTGTGTDTHLWLTVVGVVADIRERGPELVSTPAVYVPFTQTAIAFFQPSELVVRTSVPPLSIAAEVRRAVAHLDPEQPVSNVRTMDEIVSDATGGRRQLLTLIALFAGLAVVLAAVGIYSVLSYIVAQRQREVGVRIAIGATPGAVLRSVLADAARLTGAGVAAGLAGAAVTTRLLQSVLFEVSPLDVTAVCSAVLVLTGIGLIAAYVPARRAATIDPLAALRSE